MYPVVLIIAAALSVAAVTPAVADDQSECFGTDGGPNYSNPKFFPGRVEACTRLISRHTGKNQALDYKARGHWRTQLKQYDAALADLDRAVSIDPNFMEFYDFRGDIWLEKGDLDRAIANYNQAIRLDPTYAPAYFSRGRAYERKGDIERARESYQAALVPPRKRATKEAEQLQAWGQESAATRLKELDARPPAR